MEDPPGYGSYTIKIPKYLSDYVVLIRVPFAIQGRISSVTIQGTRWTHVSHSENLQPLDLVETTTGHGCVRSLTLFGRAVGDVRRQDFRYGGKLPKKNLYEHLMERIIGYHWFGGWNLWHFGSSSTSQQYCPWLRSGSEPTNTATFDISPNLSVEVWADITC